MRLEDELRVLAVDWPPTPDLAGAVAGRLPARRPPWWRWRSAGLGAALLALAVAATPARTAVLDLVGLAGGEEVRRVPGGAPGGLPPRAPSGDPAGLRAARAAVAFPVRVPAALGPPRRVLVDRRPAGGAVELRWPGASLLALDGDTRTFAQKLVGPGTTVRRVRVHGGPALLLTGAPFQYLVVDRAGVPLQRTARRVEADVLLFDLGGVGYRLELPPRAGLRRALTIARSLG